MSLVLAAASAATPDTALVLGLVLAGVAVFLFVLEFVVPSGGLIALLCALAALGSVGAFFAHDPIWGLAALAIYAVLAPVAIVFGVKVWANSPLGRRMILRTTESGSELDPSDRSIARGAGPDASLESLLGRVGRTVTPLRPVGFVRIEGRRMDAVADFGVIDADVEVEVIDARDNVLRVRVRASG